MRNRYARSLFALALVGCEALGETSQRLTTCIDVPAAADSTISLLAPYTSFGERPELRVGFLHASLVRFDLSVVPAGAAVESATLQLRAGGIERDLPAFVHRVRAPWDETVTAATFSYQLDWHPQRLTIDADEPLQTIDLTEATATWLSGAEANHGVLMWSPAPRIASIVSREGAADPPKLSVCYATTADPCEPNPCEHGGTCTDTGAGYTCECPPGYTGTNCELEIDECASMPCQNGGTCHDQVNGYTCECTIDYGGTNCEIQLCDDGNVCTEDHNSANGCVFTPNASGPACQAARASVAAGAFHTCAIRAGAVYCWGWRDSGRLGDGTSADAYTVTPAAIAGLDDAVALAGGYDHACALRAGGAISCWGANQSGQLGTGTTVSSTVPIAIDGISDAIAITAGRGHTCALRAGGTITCWGNGTSGQLGAGVFASSLEPVTVVNASGLPWTAVSANEFRTCAVRADGKALCWGANNNGQLGDGTTTSRSAPTEVVGLTGIATISSGRNHTCAATGTGTVQCWGSSLGLGRVGADLLTPVAIGLDDAVVLGASGVHSCATRVGGEVRCWGQGFQGQLGNGGGAAQSTPVVVQGITDGIATTAGYCHSCALTEAGPVRCWGAMPIGDSCRSLLGHGSTAGSNVPVTVLVP